MSIKSCMLVILLVSMLSAETFADGKTEQQKFSLNAQIRSRTELNKKGFAQSAKSPLSTLLRSRIGFTGNPSEKVILRIEVQDSRRMGQEAGVTANSANVDLHQAYFSVKDFGCALKVGRQKPVLGSQRLISSLEWHNVARVFDGFFFKAGSEKHTLSGELFTVSDPSASVDNDHTLLTGLHYGLKLSDKLKSEAYAFFDQSKPADYDRFYLGERLKGSAGNLFYEEEFIFQTGTQNDSIDNQAYYLATRVGARIGKHRAAVGLDIMSGDNDGSDNVMQTYTPTYYFGHAYFGWMDYFLKNPTTGVMDVRFDANLYLCKYARLKSGLHYFMQQNPVSGAEEPYGTELDFELHTKYYPKSNIILGAAIFLPRNGPGTVWAADKETGYYIYLMPIFNF